MSRAWIVKEHQLDPYSSSSDTVWVASPAKPLDWRTEDRNYHIRVWQLSKNSFRYEVRGRWIDRKIGRGTTLDQTIQLAIAAWKGRYSK